MGIKILVAESDSAVQQVVSYFLNLEGFEVTKAGDGISALEAVESSHPEAILLSPELIGINGIEVSRLIREKSQFNNVPILYIVESKESLEKRAGEIPPGYGLITKPIDPTKMVNTIKEYIEEAKKSTVETSQPAVSKGRSAGQEESISIEELLGWNVSEEAGKKEVFQREEPQKSPEKSPQEFIDLSTELFGAQEKTGVEKELSDLFIKQEITGEAKGGESSGIIEADLKSRITDDMIENVVSKIARDIIERKVWEIVPKIAEEEVKKEIERLKGEMPDKSRNYR